MWGGVVVGALYIYCVVLGHCQYDGDDDDVAAADDGDYGGRVKSEYYRFWCWAGIEGVCASVCVFV